MLTEYHLGTATVVGLNPRGLCSKLHGYVLRRILKKGSGPINQALFRPVIRCRREPTGVRRFEEPKKEHALS